MSCRSRILKCWGPLAVCAFLLTTARPVHGQSVTTGMLSGIVIDQQNAVLPGVSITAVHQPTGTQYAAVTDTEGRFQVPNVRAGGPYTIGSHASRTRGSSAAFRAISGPMPAGSPDVMAMRGFTTATPANRQRSSGSRCARAH